MADLEMKIGSTFPWWEFICIENEAPVDLTENIKEIRLRTKFGEATATNTKKAEIVTTGPLKAKEGRIRYKQKITDVNNGGEYKIEAEVEYSDETVEFFPEGEENKPQFRTLKLVPHLT